MKNAYAADIAGLQSVGESRVKLSAFLASLVDK
jgi:hypothetical protein